MQGLLLRLYDVDGEGERALRVIAYFDQLVRHHADVATVVRAGAALAECAAGVDVPGGLNARFGADGQDLVAGARPASDVLFADHELIESGAQVWLERAGEARELDALILERMAMAVATTLERGTRTTTLSAANGLGDPALLEILLSEKATSVERARAARLAGMPVDGVFTLVAIRGAVLAEDVLSRFRKNWNSPFWGARVEPEVVAVLGRASLLPVELDNLLPECSGVLQRGVQMADVAPVWRRLSDGLRIAGLSTSWSRWVTSGDLGCLSLLAAIDADTAAHHPDVLAIGRLRMRHGSSALDDLDALLTKGSMRQAAEAVHMHHTTLAQRARKYGSELGFDIGSSVGRMRLFVALALWTSAERQGRIPPPGRL